MTNKKTFHLLKTNKGHWYFVQNEDFPNGMEMPSATNILDVFPNPGLDYWRENTSPEEIKRKQEEGKIQGSKVHHSCFLLSAGEIVQPSRGLSKKQVMLLPLETSEDTKKKDDKLLDYLMQPFTEREYKGLQGFQNYWEEYKPITVGREIKVYHKRLFYAGTLDWVGYLWNAKKKRYEFWVIDYKISNNHDRSYEAQVVSYFKALCQMYGKNFRARLGILYVGKATKKKFQLKELEDRKRAWDDFLTAKKLWHSLNPAAKPDIKEEYDPIQVDTSFKRKGRLIKLTKQH